MRVLALSQKLPNIIARDNGNGIDVLAFYAVSYFTYYLIITSIKSVKQSINRFNFMTLQFYLSVNIVGYILFYGLKDLWKVK